MQDIDPVQNSTGNDSMQGGTSHPNPANPQPQAFFSPADDQAQDVLSRQSPQQMPVPIPPHVNSISVQYTEPAPQQNQNLQPFNQPETIQATQVLNQVAPSGQSERVSYSDAAIQEIEVAKIAPNPFQPRKIFEPRALKELSDSIKEHGVIQPLVVTKTPSGYELVVGERRFRASQLAGLEKIPAIVKETMVDQTKLEVALIENIQRQELNPIEEAQAYDRLMKTFNLTQEQVAQKVGKSRPAIANTVRLLNLPAEIQRGVSENKISEGHARALLGLGDFERMILMYKTIVEQGWNVRQVEAKVRELSARRGMDAAAPDPKLMALETELRGKFGTQVKIQRQGKGGRITIEFFSDEELEDLMEKMAATQGSGNVGYNSGV